MAIKREYWQEGAGYKDRVYVSICLEFGVILNGHGNFGHWPECIEKLKECKISGKKIADIKRFCEEMKEGDIVALRFGTGEIHAVGVIIGNYSWNNIFSDVDGWDLQHVRRVKWLWKKEKPDTPKKFLSWTIKQGDTTQKLNSEEVIKWIESLDLDYNNIENLPELPTEDPHQILSLDEIGEYLYGKGVASNTIEKLKQTFDDFQMIAKWYLPDNKPSEHETEAYLIIPLLLTLGWTPQKMAIERNNIDITLFNKLPRNDTNITALVEAKKIFNSCLSAFDQVKDYAFNKVNCNRLIVSDGLRYGVFIKLNSEWKLHAYMNINEFKNTYIIYHCKGIKEALWTMTPDWIIDNLDEKIFNNDELNNNIKENNTLEQ